MAIRYSKEYLNSLIGKKFNKLTILSFSKKDKNNSTYAVCQCDCGNIVETRLGRVINNETLSCGCVRKKYVDRKQADLIYLVWFCMIRRCYNKQDEHYRLYGERGIIVCDQWKNSFSNFYDWAINNGYRKCLSLDRINNNGNYEPSNCRWTTQKQQCRNKNTNKLITYNNETLCVVEWCEKLNLDYNLVRRRLYEGWDIEEAFFTPRRNHKS